MGTVTTRDTSTRAAARPAPGSIRRRLRALAPVAGPLLIVVTVLVAMRSFVFTDHLTNQHPDILAQWLPRFCFLGQSLGDGHVPLWNPYQMAGMPNAADPQSGWLYAPAMLLFTLLPCSRALGAFIALQPLLAGLGLYWFLRKEGLFRTAATVGGLSAAMLIAASTIGLSLPFAGTLAWTPFVLVGASGYLAATQWLPRIAWLSLGAVAWGQVASAHMSHGLAVSTLLLVAYLGAKGARSTRTGEVTARRALLLCLGFLAFLPLANLAVLLPRLDLVPHSSLRGGYSAVGPRLAEVANIDERPLATGGVWAAWPLNLGSAPGAYAGAALLLATAAAFRTRALRYLAIAFGGAGLVGYVLTLDLLIGAEWFRDLVLGLPFGDVYLHNPGRLRIIALVVIPVLGAIGIHGLREHPIARKEAVRWIAGGGLLFLALPIALGGRPIRFILLAAGIIVTVPLLLGLARGHDTRFAARWPQATWALPLVLALELSAGALLGHLYEGGNVASGMEPPEQANLAWGPLRRPILSASEYLRPTRFVEELRGQDGRYLTWVPPATFFKKGYLFNQEPEDWPALENMRGTLFRIPDALGYSPVQLPRYWSYIRATNADRVPDIFYNAAVLNEPTLSDLRLLGVRYLIARRDILPRVPGRTVAAEGRFVLWEIRGYGRRVSVVPTWYEVPDVGVALVSVLQESFDPKELAVVERDPGIERAGRRARAGTASYHENSPESIEIVAEARAPSLVVIRNAWDRNWTATVDGAPAEVLRADHFLQAVAVGRGHHEIRLTYRDPAIGRGIALSGLVWGALVIALGIGAVVTELRRRRSAHDSL